MFYFPLPFFSPLFLPFPSGLSCFLPYTLVPRWYIASVWESTPAALPTFAFVSFSCTFCFQYTVLPTLEQTAFVVGQEQLNLSATKRSRTFSFKYRLTDKDDCYKKINNGKKEAM